MEANSGNKESALLEWAVSWFRERLPENWTVTLEPAADSDAGETRTDGRLILQAPTSNSWMAVEARRSLSPLEAENLLPRLAQLVREMSGNMPVLIVAPWLGERTRTMLSQQGINYLDETGNALIKLANPAVYIEARGSSRNPNPKRRGEVRLRGPKVGRLIRTLIDVFPPYTLKELTAATNLAPGYISRILDALNEEALIKRPARGPVQMVDVPALLRRWAASYDIFQTERITTFVALEGWDALLENLRLETLKGSQIALTGSVAAARLAPVASPALLLAYTPEPEVLAERLGLLPADEGADVGLLWPFDPVVWSRTRWEDGLQFAAPPQVAVDCLTGNGRMPAEGEAVLSWLTANATAWRSTRFESLELDE
jgi:hypothetical protein